MMSLYTQFLMIFKIYSVMDSMGLHSSLVPIPINMSLDTFHSFNYFLET